jgi:hypothetical protein
MLRNLPLFIVMPSLLIGCASLATLEKEERFVENLLRHNTVYDFLEETPEVDRVLDLGGDKVRYTVIYTPRNNFESVYIMDALRHYRLYVYVSTTGEIIQSHYRRVYETEFHPERVVYPAIAIGIWFYQEFIPVWTK